MLTYLLQNTYEGVLVNIMAFLVLLGANEFSLTDQFHLLLFLYLEFATVLEFCILHQVLQHVHSSHLYVLKKRFLDCVKSYLPSEHFFS